MDKRPQRLAKNKTALMSKNASCKRWDTLEFSSCEAADDSPIQLLFHAYFQNRSIHWH
jgi:hypothetical protein